MITNPFLISGSQEPPIGTEDCQRIHYQAIQMATRGVCPHAIPESLPLATLLERARLNGAETYLFHPADIESLFAGVTLAVYRTIRTLYCSRLGRSSKMVWQILRAMATDAGAAMIPYETVWALRLHMEKLRRHSVEVQIERGKDIWWIGQTTPDITVLEGSTMRYQPAITWCLETDNVRVLAFRIASRDTGAQMPQVAKCVVSEYRLETADYILAGQAHPGFLGWIEYVCRTRESSVIVSLNALARLAFFSGSGYLTERGMGVTAVMITN